MKFVILGTGIAGLTVAKTIRQHDKISEIIMIGEEDYLTYNRPMITKAPLRGFDYSHFIVENKSWYQQKNIKILTNKKILKLEPATKTILLEEDVQITYDKCIYALGAKSRVPNIKGADNNHVLVARTIDDIAQIRKKMLISKCAVVIGGGVVGLEIAWELKKSGIKVTILEAAPHLMGNLLDKDSATLFTKKVRDAGINVYTNVEIEEITQTTVKTASNSNIEADMVIMACGIKANIDLAIDANIDVDSAVIVNEKMQTNIDDIYACGDCASYQRNNFGLINEAVAQAEVVALNICQIKKTYDIVDRAVLFNGMNTALFATGKLFGDEVVALNYQQDKDEQLLVNTLLPSSKTQVRYFFEKDKIVGGVIIGDLKEMSNLKTAVIQKCSKEEFLGRCTHVK